MTTINTAQAIYEDTIEKSGEISAEDLERQLRERSEALRGEQHAEMSEETREDLEIVLTDGEDPEDIANDLDEAADDIHSSLGGKNATMKELDPGVAGQAELGKDKMWINPKSIKSDDEKVIDKEIAEDVALHEEEHTKQSATADADGVEINGKAFDAREIREAAAISVQYRTDFLSAEYQQITKGLPMNAEDRELVRKGKFRELQAKKNSQPAHATAA